MVGVLMLYDLDSPDAQQCRADSRKNDERGAADNRCLHVEPSEVGRNAGAKRFG